MIPIIVIVPFVFAIGGLAGIVWCLVMISRSIDSESWQRVDCEILESHIQVIEGEGTEFRAIVKYKYSVNGLPYEGETVRFGKSSIIKSTAETICNRYHKGVVARVSVDPDKPERSVLIPGISPSVYVFLILAVAFLFIGTSILRDILVK